MGTLDSLTVLNGWMIWVRPFVDGLQKLLHYKGFNPEKAV